MADWHAFPHDASGFEFEGDALRSAWPELHCGDCEPFPDPEHVAAVLETHPGAAPRGFDGDVQALAGRLQDAWRAFHNGAFAGAVKTADGCGLLGHAVANKATGVYATYLEPDADRQAECFQQAIARAERAIAALPGDANAHYFHAFNLGRYSQSISVVKALKQGIGGKIQRSLERALELQPAHAEAHTAMGLYHAEIIDKVGKMIGAMTYGASPDDAETHLQRALELTPNAPIAWIEHGNGLYLLHGDKRLEEVTDCYVKASEMTPRDAMEMLDVESARNELE